ncbi:hypothetical protein BT93_C0923 [Corymbia citriodora subsp. variegata]|nr:hypothetical protein BT93_C0923 [Corymbia citriodora subsp. variegata]
MLFSHKLRPSSPRLLFCCFHDGHTAAAAYREAASLDRDDGSPRMAARSPCWWLRSTAQELPLREIRHKCRSLIAWIRRCRCRQGHIAGLEFGYDPMSYALNFEDDRESDEEFPARNF